MIMPVRRRRRRARRLSARHLVGLVFFGFALMLMVAGVWLLGNV
jgi:hypothetical protein